jgi:hypothetical protein
MTQYISLSKIFKQPFQFCSYIHSFKVLLLLTTPRAGKPFPVLDILRRNMGAVRKFYKCLQVTPTLLILFYSFLRMVVVQFSPSRWACHSGGLALGKGSPSYRFSIRAHYDIMLTIGRKNLPSILIVKCTR